MTGFILEIISSKLAYIYQQDYRLIRKVILFHLLI